MQLDRDGSTTIFHERLKGLSIMKSRPAQWFAVVALFPILAGIQPSLVHAEDYSAIRKANEDAVVYIESKRIRKDGQGIPETSHGTGFIIAESGHVMTASHVILEEDAEHVVETEGRIRSRYAPAYKLELVKRDNVDIAIAMFPDVGIQWKTVYFGNSKTVPKDAPLYTLGFPVGADLSSATGILSSKFGPKGLWQTTISLNRGNSGGPIFDLNGKVVAIASAGNESAAGITYAIPEFYVMGLRLAAATADSAGNLYAGGQSRELDDDKISKKFAFYRAVDHEGEESLSETFCLPQGYKVTSVTPSITTQNGPGTKLIAATPDARSTNCAEVSAFVKGSGVVKIGPIVVDHKGRGWLGANIEVRGEKLGTK